jgi:hypothetical protein
MANKTIYIGSGEDAYTWDELARYLRFHEGRSLSSFLAEKVKEELAKMKAKYDKMEG